VNDLLKENRELKIELSQYRQNAMWMGDWDSALRKALYELRADMISDDSNCSYALLDQIMKEFWPDAGYVLQSQPQVEWGHRPLIDTSNGTLYEKGDLVVVNGAGKVLRKCAPDEEGWVVLP